VLVPSARCPLLESARVLLAEDRAPDTVLELQHRGSPIVAMRGKIATFAGLTVTENDRLGPIFSKYVPFSGPVASDSAAVLQGVAQEAQIEAALATTAKPAPQPLARPRLAKPAMPRPRLKRQEDAA
jgi:hypothetical protein